MKIRFKRDKTTNKTTIEIENDGKIVEFSEEDINNFIQNRDVNDLIFTQNMSKEEKVNIKLMLDNLINVILKD